MGYTEVFAIAFVVFMLFATGVFLAALMKAGSKADPKPTIEEYHVKHLKKRRDNGKIRAKITDKINGLLVLATYLPIIAVIIWSLI